MLWTVNVFFHTRHHTSQILNKEESWVVKCHARWILDYILIMKIKTMNASLNLAKFGDREPCCTLPHIWKSCSHYRSSTLLHNLEFYLFCDFSVFMLDSSHLAQHCSVLPAHLPGRHGGPGSPLTFTQLWQKLFRISYSASLEIQNANYG